VSPPNGGRRRCEFVRADVVDDAVDTGSITVSGTKTRDVTAQNVTFA